MILEEENIKIEIKEEEDELQRGCSKDLNKDTESISSENGKIYFYDFYS